MLNCWTYIDRPKDWVILLCYLMLRSTQALLQVHRFLQIGFPIFRLQEREPVAVRSLQDLETGPQMTKVEIWDILWGPLQRSINVRLPCIYYIHISNIIYQQAHHKVIVLTCLHGNLPLHLIGESSTHMKQVMNHVNLTKHTKPIFDCSVRMRKSLSSNVQFYFLFFGQLLPSQAASFPEFEVGFVSLANMATTIPRLAPSIAIWKFSNTLLSLYPQLIDQPKGPAIFKVCQESKRQFRGGHLLEIVVQTGMPEPFFRGQHGLNKKKQKTGVQYAVKMPYIMYSSSDYLEIASWQATFLFLWRWKLHVWSHFPIDIRQCFSQTLRTRGVHDGHEGELTPRWWEKTTMTFNFNIKVQNCKTNMCIHVQFSSYSSHFQSYSMLWTSFPRVHHSTIWFARAHSQQNPTGRCAPRSTASVNTSRQWPSPR